MQIFFTGIENRQVHRSTSDIAAITLALDGSAFPPPFGCRRDRQGTDIYCYNLMILPLESRSKHLLFGMLDDRRFSPPLSVALGAPSYLRDVRAYPAHPVHHLAKVHGNVPRNTHAKLRRGLHLVKPRRARNECLHNGFAVLNGQPRGGRG